MSKDSKPTKTAEDDWYGVEPVAHQPTKGRAAMTVRNKVTAPTRARGRTRRTPGEMNGLEKAWSLHLAEQKHAGLIVDWWFEPMSIRLGRPACSYKPDFMVITSDGYVEFHETKGYMEAAANIRIKVAADKFPQFVFRLIRKKTKKQGGGFDVQVVGPAP